MAAHLSHSSDTTGWLAPLLPAPVKTLEEEEAAEIEDIFLRKKESSSLQLFIFPAHKSQSQIVAKMGHEQRSKTHCYQHNFSLLVVSTFYELLLSLSLSLTAVQPPHLLMIRYEI